MLSDDKVSHLTHVLFNGLMEKGLLRLKEDEGSVRRTIKRAIKKELSVGEEMDAAAKRKIQSMSKRPVEGSNEWEILYKKYMREEEVRRGKG